MQEITQQIQAVLRKVSKIPFDTLGEDAHVLMTTLNATVARLDTTLARTDKAVLPEVRDALRELRQTIEALRGATSPDAPLQQDLRQTLQGLGDAARALRTLADTVESQPESLLRGRRESN
ncbi:hypothetical protein [Pararhodospirillum photometricum]|nr:hypothetical protein [Pararhodospirillum photometricum]